MWNTTTVIQWLNGLDLDLLEVSGGTYEQPPLFGYRGKANIAVTPLRASTRQREAYFLDYAAAIRRVAMMPLMVTGGFRTRAGHAGSLQQDVSGLTHQSCSVPIRGSLLL